MNFLIFNLILAVLPALLLLIYFYGKDSRKREPVGLIIQTFLLGFAIVIPAALAEIALSGFEHGMNHHVVLLFRAFIIAGLVEEGAKYMAVRYFLLPNRNFDEITDGIVYTITLSLGFALFENILYSGGSASVLLIRGVTAVPLHAAASGIMGYYLGYSKMCSKPLFGRGLFWAVFVHGLYDYLLFTGTFFAWLVLPLLAGALVTVHRLYKKAQEDDQLRGYS